MDFDGEKIPLRGGVRIVFDMLNGVFAGAIFGAPREFLGMWEVEVPQHLKDNPGLLGEFVQGYAEKLKLNAYPELEPAIGVAFDIQK